MSARGLGAAAALSLILTGPAAAAVEIQWWHAMQGERGRQLDRLAHDFNETQNEYRIVPVFKGNYAETLAAAIVALRSRQQPPIVQVVEVATDTMMAAKGAIYPVHELMKDQGEGFDPEEVADPLAPENLLKSSGRGIFLIRSFMDDHRAETSGGRPPIIERPAPRAAAGPMPMPTAMPRRTCS